MLHGFRRYAEIHLAVGDQLRYLQGRTHVRMDVHPGIAARQLLDHRREGVSSDSVGRGQGQFTQGRVAVTPGPPA